MPPQPKPPQGTQATPLTDAARVLGKISAYAPGLRVEEFVPASFARQLEIALHALAGALGQYVQGDEHAEKEEMHEAAAHYSEAQKLGPIALALYRTLTSADERRGG